MDYKTQQNTWQLGLHKKELYWRYFIMMIFYYIRILSNTQAIQLNIYIKHIIE